MVDLFQNASSDFTRKVYTNMIAPKENSLPNFHEGLKHLCSGTNEAFLTSSYVVDAMEERKELECSIMPLPQTSFADTLCFIIAKGSPYRDILNYKLVFYVATIINPLYLSSGVGSALNRNEYQVYLLRVKAAGAQD
jgi:hypothetical protein